MSQKKSSFIGRIALAGVALTVLLAGLSLPALAQVKLGALYPLSGPLALLGEESWRGAEIARVMRNEKGGISGKKIEFVRADIPDVSAARSEAERLIRREGLKLLTGTYASSLSLVSTEVAARAGVIYFEMGAATDAITKRGYKTVFRTNPPVNRMTGVMMQFSKEFLCAQLGKKPSEVKVAMAHEDSAFGSASARALEGACKEFGFPLVAVIPYSASAVDLSSVIMKLRQAEPDILVCSSYANDSILLCRQGKELGLKIKAIFGCGAGHALGSYNEALGANANGVYVSDVTQYVVNTKFTPGLTDMVDRYQKMFKEKPRSGHSLLNFFGANVLFDILDKTGGDLDAEKFIKAAKAYTKEPGTTAAGYGVKFDDSNQNTLSDFQITQWRDGVLGTVYPAGAAVKEPAMITPCSP